MSDTAAERALLCRAAAGDREAFDAFVHTTAPSVWTVLRRLTATESSAEDALQETFISAWRGASSFRPDGNARSWLYGIARRQAARTWRRRAGEPLDSEPLSELADRAGWGADPESIASRAEDRAVLLHAISTLSDADQLVLTRCDLEGDTPTELAQELDIAPGTLRVRLHRARLRLMAALKSEVTHG